MGMDSGSRYLSRSIRVEAARELGLGNWAGLVWNEARIPAGIHDFFGQRRQARYYKVYRINSTRLGINWY